jgi:hypothetical protein
MITGFEDITYELTKYEREVLLPLFVRGLKTKVGKHNSVTSSTISTTLKGQGYKVSGPRIRKIVNYIRVHRLIKNLIATSKGYYISEDPEEIEKYVESLRQRIREITLVANTYKF